MIVGLHVHADMPEEPENNRSRGYHIGIDNLGSGEYYAMIDDPVDGSSREGSSEANNYGGYEDVDGFMGYEGRFGVENF